MFLVGLELVRYVDVYTTGVEPGEIQGSSVDLACGDYICYPRKNTWSGPEKFDKYVLGPLSSVLLSSRAIMTIPLNKNALLVPKSSLSRKGIMVNVGLGDPGWFAGAWSYVLFNATEWPFLIHPGDYHTQVLVYKNYADATKDYSVHGNYNATTVPTPPVDNGGLSD